MRIFNEIRPQFKLYLKWVSDEIGWGVFTDSFISSGSTVERCYSLLDNEISAPHRNYTFQTDKSTYDVYHVLGFGAIYNHSNNPNIVWKCDSEEEHIISFYAMRDIQIGEELRHDYGEKYWCSRKKQPII